MSISGAIAHPEAEKSTFGPENPLSNASTLGPVRRTSARDGSTRPGDPSTYSALSARIKADGLLDRTPVFYISLFIILVLAFAGVVAGSVLLGNSWFQLVMAAALGIVMTQFAFLAHEAAHRQIFRSGVANDRLGRILASAVVGMSFSWWMNKHSKHHANPNRVGKDPDIEQDTVSFLEEDAAARTGFLKELTKRQGYLFFPLLLLEGINLHKISVEHIIENWTDASRRLEAVMIAARFAILYTAIFWFLPLGMAFAFIGVQLAVFGLYMGASFAPNHKGMPVIGKDEKLDFLTKQVRTSRSITGGIWVTFLMGGLNYQVEHHLFPSMPRPHLAAAQALVLQHCREINVNYTQTSLIQSYAIVIRYLNTVGLAARDPFDCPLVAARR